MLNHCLYNFLHFLQQILNVCSASLLMWWKKCWGEFFAFVCFFSVSFFVFHAKSGTTMTLENWQKYVSLPNFEQKNERAGWLKKAINYHEIYLRPDNFVLLQKVRNLTPCRPKGPPLYYFEISILDDWPSNSSSSAFGANIYKFWGGSARQKNTTFWSKFSKKCKKRLFWPLFWKNYLWRWKFGQFRVFIVIWESSRNQFGRLKKR